MPLLVHVGIGLYAMAVALFGLPAPQKQARDLLMGRSDQGERTIVIPCIVDNAMQELLTSYIEFAPWAIWGALWVAYVVTFEGAFWIVSMSITLSSLPLYVFQVYIDDVHPGFFCPAVERWSFPNLEVAAVSSFFVFAIFFRWYYKMAVTYFQWFILGVFFLTPSIVHVAIAETDFWKVALSVAYGVVSALVICPILWTNQMTFAYLFTLPYFWTWFRQSILLRDDRSRAKYEELRKWRQTESERARASPGLLAGPSSLLSSRSEDRLPVVSPITDPSVGLDRPRPP